MPPLAASPSFKLFMVCCVLLSFQMLVLAGMTAARRSSRQTFLNPEDDKVSFAGAKFNEGVEHPDVARIMRAHRNTLESVPLFFALGLIFVLAGGSTLGAQICFGAFTGARMLHSVFYLNALQPWRTISYGIGAFSLIGLMVQILMIAFS